MSATLTRRTVLGAGTGALAAGIVAAGAEQALGRPLAAPAAHPTPAGSGLPVRSDFDGLVGQAFAAASIFAVHTLTLAEVADLAPAASDPEHGFRLGFTTDAGARDGIYRLTAPNGAQHLLFLTRVGNGAPTLAAIVDRTR